MVQQFNSVCVVFCTIVDNIGLTCSAESMHTIAARRLSRRGTASRHHPHRTSSRRNKENGNGVHRNSIGRSGSGTSNTHQDDLRNQRKQRTVSFEQNQLQSPSEYFAPPGGLAVASAGRTASHWNEEAHSSHDIYNSANHSSSIAPTSILNFMTSSEDTQSHNSYQINSPFQPPRV